MKVLIFDSSTLISLAMNGLFEEIRQLKKIFDGKFLITKEVRNEIIDKPLNIKRFELEAIKIQELLDDKTLSMPEDIKIDSSEISRKTYEVLELANNCFFSNGKEIHLIDAGEASCIAISKHLNEKQIENIMCIDERTTRNIIESTDDLKNFLQKKLHSKIEMKKNALEYFKNMKVIRSAELVYIAWKKNLIKSKNKKVLDAMLWAVKFKGCSISEDEIREIEKVNNLS